MKKRIVLSYENFDQAGKLPLPIKLFGIVAYAFTLNFEGQPSSKQLYKQDKGDNESD